MLIGTKESNLPNAAERYTRQNSVRQSIRSFLQGKQEMLRSKAEMGLPTKYMINLIMRAHDRKHKRTFWQKTLQTVQG